MDNKRITLESMIVDYEMENSKLRRKIAMLEFQIKQNQMHFNDPIKFKVSFDVDMYENFNYVLIDKITKILNESQILWNNLAVLEN